MSVIKQAWFVANSAAIYAVNGKESVWAASMTSKEKSEVSKAIVTNSPFTENDLSCDFLSKHESTQFLDPSLSQQKPLLSNTAKTKCGLTVL